MAKKKDDKTLLIEAMANVENGVFEQVDPGLFEDQALAGAFNNMVKGVVERNNKHLESINESMGKIGNGFWIKILFELIMKQQRIVDDIQALNKKFSERTDMSRKEDIDALSLIRQFENSIVPCIDGINEIISSIANDDELRALANNKLARFHRLLVFNSKALMLMLMQVGDAVNAIKDTYEIDKSMGELASPLIQDISDLTESCNRMSVECFNAGHHMYEISRIVDDSRNDMFRYNSKLDHAGSIEVFKVDHIVLTWRLYNHIQEYEVLKRSQVDNPESCKLGLWLRIQSPEWIRELPEYKKVFDAHEALHEVAVRCYDAKERYDIDQAMAEFELALTKLDPLLAALDELSAAVGKKKG
ncbi:MAG: CZB domain-containing protein [Lachnospiraceae bacterium]|nr:CZB domain-containing protein [Lachnospiraceae bacterium]MBP5184731.1 CZB domain-containing protein [Lachnospiraceae bacterium]